MGDLPQRRHVCEGLRPTYTRADVETRLLRLTELVYGDSDGRKGGEQVRRSIAQLGDRIDGDATLRSWEESSWEESLNASVWDGIGVWVHGDLLLGNLLVVDGRLSAVIDFGGLNVGDPACDLQPAWNVFVGDSRMQFRAELEVDDSSWLRGRGWAPYQSVRQDEKFVWAAKALINGTGSIRRPRPPSATAYSDLQRY